MPGRWLELPRERSLGESDSKDHEDSRDRWITGVMGIRDSRASVTDVERWATGLWIAPIARAMSQERKVANQEFGWEP